MREELDYRNGALREMTESGAGAIRDFDLSLLRDSLAKSPWERMQANDDALNFAESLQAAMKNRHAKP